MRSSITRLVLAAILLTAVVSTTAAQAHVKGCHSRGCDGRISKKRHQLFPKNHPERYRPWTTGTATWYGPGFYGHTMACGGTYAANLMVVAHRTLPCGTKLHICRLGGKCADATVRDRGPYSGAILDLSPAVRDAIGATGTTQVRFR